MATNGKLSVLHAVPNSSQNSNMFYHGSTKDILGRTEYFLDRGINFHQVGYKKEGLAAELSFIDIAEYSHILIEYPQTFSCFKYIRSRNKKAKILLRSHNSENWVSTSLSRL